VYRFDGYVSAIVPWLREIGIVDYVYSLKKDEIQIAIIVPRVGEGYDLRTIIDTSNEITTIGCLQTMFRRARLHASLPA
jgi:hypothetical protein